MIEAIYILIIGAILLGAGWLGYANKYKGVAMLIGAIMVLGGAFYPGYGLWEDMLDVDTTPDAAIISGVSFDITPTNGTYNYGDSGVAMAGTVAGDEKSITFPITVNNDNDFAGNASAVNFSIKPTAPIGATADDLATIYFSVDENQKYDGEEIYRESSGVMSAKWLINVGTDTENYEGQHTMLMTDEDWLCFGFWLDGAGTDTFGEEFDAIGDKLDIPITFWSDGGWSETFTITLICVDAA